MRIHPIIVACFMSCALGIAPALAADTPNRTWDTAKLRQLVTEINGGKDSGFGPWKREDRDGDERWVSAYGNEHWEIRPYIVVYGVRIGHQNRTGANRFTLIMASLTDRVMALEKHSDEKTGEVLAGLARAAAARPGEDASASLGSLTLTLRKIDPVNAWVYSIAQNE